MTSRTEKDKAKQIQDKCQTLLNEMLRDEDNKYCVDCDSKGPRWASWNLGVFLCIRCAGIHRKLGVHISKVKSVNLDTWTPEQVVSLQQMGNSRARAVYEANLPDNFRRPQSDTSLESFVRAKYEHKKYIAREWVPPPTPKVDWEKEIDEEIERQKRKKKAANASSSSDIKKPIKITEVPQIPKPKSASPKPNRSTGNDKPTQDLLGLQNGEDNFTGFLSAPSEDTKKEEPAVDPVKLEEENFFNQPAPTEKEKTKLTKDSILALYGNNPQTAAHQSTMFVQPGGFPAQNYAAFGGFPQQAFHVQNGAIPPGAPVTVAPAPAPPTHQFPTTTPYQQFPQTQYVQGQYVVPSQYHPQFSGIVMPAQTQFPTNMPSQFPATGFHAVAPTTFGPQPPVSNPFFNTQQPSSLPQQFAGMSLGTQVPPQKTGTSVATNLWQ